MMTKKLICLLLSISICIYCDQTISIPKRQLRLDFMQSLEKDSEEIVTKIISDGQGLTTYVDANFLKDAQFTGTYYSHGDTKLFDYISSTEGLIETIFFYNPQWPSSDTNFNGFALQIFDPVYHDRNFVVLLLKLGQRTSENQWQAVDISTEFGSFWKGRQKNQDTLQNTNYTVTVNNIQSQDLNSVKISINISGFDQQSYYFDITSQVMYNSQKWSIIGYCFYTTVVVLSQIFCLGRILQKIDTDTPHLAQKISLTTVSICNIMDFYLTIIHIQYIISSVSSFYLFYIFPAASYIFLFIIYDMKLLFMVWRSHTLRQIDNPQDLRKNLTIFYIKFYVGLFLYLAAMYFFAFDQWFIIMQNLVMIPQIVRNTRVGNNPGFQPFYVLGYLGLRFLIPLYERTCPDNHFLLMPMIGVIISLAILYVIQIVFLYLQFRFGPRFFIPRFLQPDYFDYRAKIKYSEDTQELECSICLQNFFQNQDNNINYSTLELPVIQQRSVMKTPCNHFFHQQCLTSWTDVKLECPTCRTPLPPL